MLGGSTNYQSTLPPTHSHTHKGPDHECGGVRQPGQLSLLLRLWARSAHRRECVACIPLRMYRYMLCVGGGCPRSFCACVSCLDAFPLSLYPHPHPRHQIHPHTYPQRRRTGTMTQAGSGPSSALAWRGRTGRRLWGRPSGAYACIVRTRAHTPAPTGPL